MAFPGYPLADDKTDDTIADEDHAPHHNDLAAAVNALQAELTAAKTVVRTRRHRNGLFVAASATTNMFAANATGTNQETEADITFTTNATNGYFTVALGGTYAMNITIAVATPMASDTSALNITAGGLSHRLPILSATGGMSQSVVKYLAPGSTIQFSITNGSPSSRTLTICQVEIAKVTLA